MSATFITQDGTTLPVVTRHLNLRLSVADTDEIKRAAMEQTPRWPSAIAARASRKLSRSILSTDVVRVCRDAGIRLLEEG